MPQFLRSSHPHSLQGSVPLMPDDVQVRAHMARSIRTGETGFRHVRGRVRARDELGGLSAGSGLKVDAVRAAAVFPIVEAVPC